MQLKEYDVALKYYKLATKDPMGQWGMGTLYYNGWGVDQDYSQVIIIRLSNEGELYIAKYQWAVGELDISRCMAILTLIIYYKTTKTRWHYSIMEKFFII